VIRFPPKPPCRFRKSFARIPFTCPSADPGASTKILPVLWSQYLSTRIGAGSLEIIVLDFYSIDCCGGMNAAGKNTKKKTVLFVAD
jgi:hypothetical protein